MAYKICTNCNCNRLPPSFKYDKAICNMCFIADKKIEWEQNGTVFLKKCSNCPHEGNMFTDFTLTSNGLGYTNKCKGCISEYYTERFAKLYSNKSKVKAVRITQSNQISYKTSKAKQDDFVSRFNKKYLGVK